MACDRSINFHGERSKNPLLIYLFNGRKQNDKGWIWREEAAKTGLDQQPEKKHLLSSEKKMLVECHFMIKSLPAHNSKGKGDGAVTLLAYGFGVHTDIPKYTYDQYIKKNKTLPEKGEMMLDLWTQQIAFWCSESNATLLPQKNDKRASGILVRSEGPNVNVLKSPLFYKQPDLSNLNTADQLSTEELRVLVNMSEKYPDAASDLLEALFQRQEYQQQLHDNTWQK